MSQRCRRFSTLFPRARLPTATRPFRRALWDQRFIEWLRYPLFASYIRSMSRPAFASGTRCSGRGGSWLLSGKGKGCQSLLANYRDVTVVGADANQFTPHTRAGFLPALINLSGHEQFGAGLNGGACDLAHLHIAQALAYAMRRNKSAAVVSPRHCVGVRFSHAMCRTTC